MEDFGKQQTHRSQILLHPVHQSTLQNTLTTSMIKNSVIGVCGTNGAGKSMLCQYLASQLQCKSVFSLSDIIREELTARHQELSRDNLIACGNELRNKHGSGVLGDRTATKIGDSEPGVIDSIRHPDEVAALRTRLRTRFVLVHVTADPDVRLRRLKLRGRIGEADLTVEQFKEQEAKELANVDPKGQQLLAVFELADVIVENNDDDDTAAADGDGTPEFCREAWSRVQNWVRKQD